MSEELAPLTYHEPKFDKSCPICVHGQRNLIEKYYIRRRPMHELVRVFAQPEDVFHQHARAVGLYKKRANNTAAIVDFVLEQGVEALHEGKMELGVKDLMWAVNHRDKLLGRIRENIDINTAPVVHIHTSIPGVGGISNSDVKEIKAAEVKERLPLPSDLVIQAEFEVVEEVPKLPKPERTDGNKDKS